MSRPEKMNNHSPRANKHSPSASLLLVPGCLILASLVCFGPSPALAASGPKSATDMVLASARVLYDKQDYAGAISEAKRFLFLYPGHAKVRAAIDLIADSHKAIASRDLEKPGQKGTPRSSPDSSLLIPLIHFYQDHMRTYQVSSCPSYPNCSEYTLQAIRKHGAFMGTFLFIDRMFREFTTAGRPPQVRSRGRSLHYDPLEANDYWLARTKERP
jgi:putative component of membrane protein insertase Oxa1/YidC/SpoIIIJ protein YidD